MCFPKDFAVFSRTRVWQGSAPDWTVYLEGEDDTISAHAGIVDRIIRVGEETIRVAGVQNVFVLPEWRGRGLCDRVMEVVAEHCLSAGFDCGLLFCVPKLVKVYRRTGWRRLGAVGIIRIDEKGMEVPLPGPNAAMALPLNRPAFPAGTIQLRGNDW